MVFRTRHVFDSRNQMGVLSRVTTDGRVLSFDDGTTLDPNTLSTDLLPGAGRANLVMDDRDCRPMVRGSGSPG